MVRYFVIGPIWLMILAVSANDVVAQAPPPAPQNGPSATAQNPADKPADAPLSKKLDESEGVLTPPKGVDPEIDKAPPAKTGDKMPVIIPPGEPGGDQSVQPK